MNNIEKKIEILAREIKRRGAFLSADLVGLAELKRGQDHIFTLHVGLSDSQLIKRGKETRGMVSSFFSKNDLSLCLYEFFTEDYNAKCVAKFILDKDSPEEMEFESFRDEYVGKILLPNGALKKVESYHFVLEKRDEDYRNPITGMPFDIKNAYLVE